MFRKFLISAVLVVAALTTSGQTVVPIANHRVTLTWTPPANAATCVAPCALSYEILRSTVSGQETVSGQVIARIDGGSLNTFTDTSVPPSTTVSQTFFYIIRPLISSQGFRFTGPPSNEVSATFSPTVAPGTPPELATVPLPPTGFSVASSQ